MRLPPVPLLPAWPHASRRNSLVPTNSRWPGNSRRTRGFSLVELVVGALISTLVITAAVKAILALVQGDRDTQVELNRKDDVGRVLGLLQDEIRNAQRVESGGSLTALSGCSTTPQLILHGVTANETISYGLRSQPADNSWRGPAVLVRCGLPYGTNGTLDSSASRGEQEVLDSLTASGFSASTLGGTGSISRNVELTLISAVSGTAITNLQQVPINSNQVYGMASGGATACPDGTGNVTTGCLDPDGESKHYRPVLTGSSTTISGDVTLEDVFYFDGNRAEYSLTRTQDSGSGSCAREQCTVRLGTTGPSITITNADVLVFRDRQIRL